jgi:WD40 repeat protein
LYDAFISYRQVEPDRTIAKRLHKALETYRVPRALVKEGTHRRLKRIFRDKDELAASSNLGEKIREAVQQSRFLIVVCSRQTPKSQWISKEIETFRESGREHNILALLIEGEPREAFPVLLREARPTTVLEKDTERETVEMAEPLAADIRAPKLSQSLTLLKVEKLRLIAPMLGRSFDDLRQREHRRFVRRLVLINALMSALVVSFAVLAAYAFKQRNEAERRGILSTAQALAAYAPREQEQGRKDERAALLALQAYRFHKRHGGTRLDQIDKALRQVLTTPHFSVVLSAGRARLVSVAFSRNGQLLAAGAYDSKVRLWNLERRGAPPIILPHRSGVVWSLAFSSNRNMLAAGTENGHVLLWEFEKTGQVRCCRVLGDHSGKCVTSIAVSPDSKKLASACVDGKVRVWNLQTHEVEPLIFTCGQQQQPIVWSVAFHPNSNYTLASGSADGKVRIWDIRQPKTPARVLDGHDNAVRSLAFSPDGCTIACGTDRTAKFPTLSEMVARGLETLEPDPVGGTVWLWDLRQKKPEPRTLKGHKARVSSLAFAKNGQILASGSIDRTVCLWPIDHLEAPREVLQGHVGGVEAVAFSPDGRTLASVGGSDASSSVRLWDMRQPTGEPRVLSGHDGAVRSLAFSRDGTLASAGGEDGTVRLWNLQEANEVTALNHDGAWAVAVAFGPDGRTVASGSKTGGLDPDNTVRLWDVVDPCEPRAVLPGHKSPVESLAFSSDGKLLASSGRNDQQILLWELDQPKTESPADVLKTISETTMSVRFARGNKVLAWASDDTVQVRDKNQPEEKQIVLKGHKGPVNSIALSPDGWKLASGSADANVGFWDLHRHKEEPVWLKHGANVNCVAIDSNGTTLASGGDDGRVQVWDLNNLTADARVLTRPGSRVFALAFSPDGRWLVAGCSDETIVAWPRTEFLAEMVCQKVWRNLRDNEWREFVATDDYECTCENLPSGRTMPGD